MTAKHRLGASKSAAQKERVRADRPLCPRCARQGIVRAGIILDHIVPLCKARSPEELVFLQRDGNTQLLCNPCNDEKTAEDFQYAVKGVGEDGWPTSPSHPANSGRVIVKQK